LRIAATPIQPALFVEFVEIATTRDEPFADGTRPVSPSGEGWIIVDFGDEHSTRWERRRLLPAWGRQC
jgi:hypothetical protein